MPRPYMSEKDFIETWNKHGSASKMSGATGIAVRAIYDRRKRLQGRGYVLPTTDPVEGYETRSRLYDDRWTYPRVLDLDIQDGELLPPETCEVIGGQAWFRGEVVS